jgi:uncharacterized membrane protein
MRGSEKCEHAGSFRRRADDEGAHHVALPGPTAVIGPDARGSIRDSWRSQLWPIPTAGVVVAAALGVALPRFDAGINDDLPVTVTGYLFSGGPEAARTVLSAIAGSLITVTSLTFSLTVVTLQLASSQYSPRILRTFTADRFVHVTLAVLLATFVYSVTVLRVVRASLSDQSAFVPQLSVTLAYLFGLGSVTMLVLFLAHLARKIRVESMLRDVHVETVRTMDRMLGDEPADQPGLPGAPDGVLLVCAVSSGFLTSVDERTLRIAAIDADAVIVIDRLPGDSLIAGTPMARVWARDGASLDDETLEALAETVAAAVRTGFERTAAQDPAFGLRQLVDIALKALSPGINDPTTAVHALSHVAALVCRAVGGDLGPRRLRDDDGRVCVVLHRPDLAMLLELAVAQPRRYGAGEPEVLARLFALLREVAWSTRRPVHHRAIAAQLERLCDTVGQQDFDGSEQARLAGLASSVRQVLDGRWSQTHAR